MRAVRAGVGLTRVARAGPPGAGRVVVRVRAAGVNRPDVLQDRGLYPARPGVTDVLGLEVAGEVVEVGSGTEWKVGDEVCALVAGGGYAEECVALGTHCLPVPFRADGPDGALDRWVRAAALPETAFTVWNNLFWAGPETLRGKSVLVHGGSSGIGTTAIVLAKAFGASLVQTTAGTDAKVRFCIDSVGADAAFNYRDPDWWDRAERADVVLDMVGGDYLQRNLGLLRDHGRLVIIGFLQSPVSAKVNMSRVLLKSLCITGSVLRSAPDEHKTALRNAVAQHVWPRIESGALPLPFLSATFGLDEYRQAHEMMEASGHMGKIALTID